MQDIQVTQVIKVTLNTQVIQITKTLRYAGPQVIQVTHGVVDLDELEVCLGWEGALG